MLLCSLQKYLNKKFRPQIENYRFVTLLDIGGCLQFSQDGNGIGSVCQLAELIGLFNDDAIGSPMGKILLCEQEVSFALAGYTIICHYGIFFRRNALPTGKNHNLECQGDLWLINLFVFDRSHPSDIFPLNIISVLKQASGNCHLVDYFCQPRTENQSLLGLWKDFNIQSSINIQVYAFYKKPTANNNKTPHVSNHIQSYNIKKIVFSANKPSQMCPLPHFYSNIMEVCPKPEPCWRQMSYVFSIRHTPHSYFVS